MRSKGKYEAVSNHANGMLSKEEIEKARSPRGLRQFVTCRKEKINRHAAERHDAILNKGIYKAFSEANSAVVGLSGQKNQGYKWRIQLRSSTPGG